MSQNVCVCHFPSSTSSTYIALQPLGVFDLSPTSSTCHIPSTVFELQCRLLFIVFELEQILN